MTKDLPDSDGSEGRSGPDVVVRANASGFIVFASATCRVLGYEPQDLVGKLGLDFVHPDDRVRYVENTASLYRPATGSARNRRVHRFRRKDGTWAWLQGNPSLLPSRPGMAGEILNFFEPISEDAAAQALLE